MKSVNNDACGVDDDDEDDETEASSCVGEEAKLMSLECGIKRRGLEASTERMRGTNNLSASACDGTRAIAHNFRVFLDFLLLLAELSW